MGRKRGGCPGMFPEGAGFAGFAVFLGFAEFAGFVPGSCREC